MSVLASFRRGALPVLAATLGAFGALGVTNAVAQTRANATPPYSLTNGGPTLGQQSGDALITAKAKAALLAASDLDSGDIHVTTASGVVTLSGVVPRRAQKALAGQAVRQIDNVVGVRNTLDVDEAPQ